MPFACDLTWSMMETTSIMTPTVHGMIIICLSQQSEEPEEGSFEAVYEEGIIKALSSGFSSEQKSAELDSMNEKDKKEVIIFSIDE